MLAWTVSTGCCGLLTASAAFPVAGIPVGGHAEFGDDNGGVLTTVVAYSAFFALFPLLLVVVTVLGFLLGRDSGFWARQVRGLLLVAFRVLTPRQIPSRQLGAGVAWQVVQAVGGYVVSHHLRHTSQVYGVFAIVLGLLFWLYLGAAHLPEEATRIDVTADQHTHEPNAATPLPVAPLEQDVAAPQPPTPGQHRDVAGDDAPTAH